MREDEPAVFSARGEEPEKEKEESLIREMRHTEGQKFLNETEKRIQFRNTEIETVKNEGKICRRYKQKRKKEKKSYC